MLYSGAGTFVVLKLIGLVMPLRATATDEATGLDITAHGEEAYAAIGGSSPAAEEASNGRGRSRCSSRHR